jgi:hypothetical protein
LEKRIISNTRKARGDKELENAQKVYEKLLAYISN